ncbi:hypothetical protein DYB34_009420 [Aphanomyces astaci]|uniref:Uncharacterized protein n=1 Tax=Aphanomyces astaci TaxID=112090 RepID=A0A3R6W1Q7_APHAT|nr:hypothetical protein DYB34_009420 [Aphanomyces astaci]
MKRSQIGQDATQAFLLAARTACTYTWDSTGRCTNCTCHMPPDLVTAATNLQTSLNCATTPAWRQMLWHNQVTHNDWVRDHRARPLKEAPYDTFADAFGSTTTTTRWSFVPRHHATIQDKAHLPWFFMLSVGLGLQAPAPLQDPHSRVWFPTPPPRVNLRRPPPFVKRLCTIIGSHLQPLPNIADKYAKRRAALCAALETPYNPDAWTKTWHEVHLPASLQWFQYRWHFQAFRFKQSAAAPRCPFCEAPDGPSHTFWWCPRAQQLWTTLLTIWYGATAARPSDHTATLITNEQPRPAPWMLHAPRWTTHGTAYDNVCHQGWLLLRSLGLRLLWTDRCNAIHANPLDPPTLPASLPSLAMVHFQALATYHTRRCHQLRAEAFTALVQQCRRSTAGHLTPPPTPPRVGLLLFDGAFPDRTQLVEDLAPSPCPYMNPF